MIKHSALTMVFEKALQSISPGVTCPYWDYTIDAERYYAVQSEARQAMAKRKVGAEGGGSKGAARLQPNLHSAPRSVVRPAQ